MTKIESENRLPTEARPSAIESKTASQAASQGPQIGRALNLFLRFIWIISFSWTSASFSDWKTKQTLTISLAKAIVDAVESKTEGGLKFEKKETLQEYYKVHLEALSIDQLNNLKAQFEQDPDKKYLIHDFTRTNPKDLPAKLAEYAVLPPPIKSEPFSFPFEEMGIVNGIFSSGFQYEMHLHFKIPKDQTVLESFQGNVEIHAYDPVSKQMRNLLVPLTIEKKCTGRDVRERLQQLALSMQDPKKNKEYEQLFKAIPTPRLNTAEALIDEMKKGNIYEVEGKPSLFPEKPSIYTHLTTISTKDIESAKKRLLENKLAVARLTLFSDKLGSTTQVDSSISSRTVKIKGKFYLEMTFQSQYKNKNLNYTTRLPYQEGEKLNAVIERISTDGTLARAMLLATSSFTKEVIP